MNADSEFLKLCREMREAQREYFDKRTRSQAVLDKARRLEREFDAALARIVKRQEPSLFDGES